MVRSLKVLNLKSKRIDFFQPESKNFVELLSRTPMKSMEPLDHCTVRLRLVSSLFLMPSLFGQNSERKIFMAGNNTGSFFGFWGPVCRLWVPVFCYAPQILVVHPFFHNAPLKYYNAPAHYEKWVHYNKMGGHITKKRVYNNGTCNWYPAMFPETRNKNHCYFRPQKFLTGVGDLNYKTICTEFGLTVLSLIHTSVNVCVCICVCVKMLTLCLWEYCVKASFTLASTFAFVSNCNSVITIDNLMKMQM